MRHAHLNMFYIDLSDLRDGSPNRMNFRKNSDRPLTPPPLIFGKSHFNFFGKRLKMPFIRVQNMQYKFLDWKWPPQSTLELFQKKLSNLVAWPIPKGSLSQYFFRLSMVLWGWICGSSVYGKLLQHNKYPEFYKFSALLSCTKRIQKFLCQLKSGVFQCKRQSLWRPSFQESIKLKTYQNNT